MSPASSREIDPKDSRLKSCLCTQQQLESPVFQSWAQRIGEPGRLNRKIWEWCYIAQALRERGMLQPGRRGLGFAVGQEPLVSLFADAGCEITATDLDTERAANAGWVRTNQHSRDLETLNRRGLCDSLDFQKRVTFRHVDMTRIPPDFKGGFDFLWSSCSFEHLGSLALGEQFVYNAMACLKPGGVAAHTTEFNVSSNTRTVDHRAVVLYRRCDMERIADRLSACGHTSEPFSFDAGDLPVDHVVDVPPYSQNGKLKLLVRNHVCTSVGMIFVKTGQGVPQAPQSVTPRTLRDRYRPVRQWLKNSIMGLARRRAA